MKISVIIATYNGGHKISNCLLALENQAFKDFEVIVVVDGSQDDTVKLLLNSKYRLDNFKIILQDNKGRAGARNTGTKHAKYDILVFFDDDMRPTPDNLQKHFLHHQQVKNSILVGSVIEEAAKMQTDIQHYRAYLSRKWTNELNAGVINKPFLTAANCSMPKAFFSQLAGFNEKLTDAEDFELAMRVFDANIPIYFNPDILAWHDDLVTCKSYIKRQRQYALAHQKLNELVPTLYQKYNQNGCQPLSTFKKLFYGFWAHRFWVKLIDKRNIFMILPKKIRYKIYDWVIAALGLHFKERNL